MKSKRHSLPQIMRILRQGEGEKSIVEVCREHNITEQTFHRWKRKYGGMELQDVRGCKELEKQNAELKKLVAEQILEIRVLKEVTAKKW